MDWGVVKIYTGNAFGKKFEELKKHDLGIMISSSATHFAKKYFRDVPCALDNGAFAAWQKGYPFQADVFRDTIKHCYKEGIPLDFITCPDIVAAGQKSLRYSYEWAKGELKTAPNLALVVRDGMKDTDITRNIWELFTHIFIGGTDEWKWETAEGWVNFAHDLDMQCHIGKVGTLKRLFRAHEIGADSVDSTNFARNETWDVVDEFMERIGGKSKRLPGMDEY